MQNLSGFSYILLTFVHIYELGLGLLRRWCLSFHRCQAITSVSTALCQLNDSDCVVRHIISWFLFHFRSSSDVLQHSRQNSGKYRGASCAKRWKQIPVVQRYICQHILRHCSKKALLKYLSASEPFVYEYTSKSVYKSRLSCNLLIRHCKKCQFDVMKCGIIPEKCFRYT